MEYRIKYIEYRIQNIEGYRMQYKEYKRIQNAEYRIQNIEGYRTQNTEKLDTEYGIQKNIEYRIYKNK